MATTASALSLANFQLITSAQVPLGCILAYNRQIPSCTNADFTRGRGCSQECAGAIFEVQENLQYICGDGDGSSTSILAQAMQGTLVDVLCPAAGLPTTTSSTITKITLTTVRPPRTTTSTERSESPSTSTSTSSSTTETPLASDIPEPSSSQPAPPQQTGTPSVAPVPSQTRGGQQITPPAAPRPDTGIGVGSPFDEPLLDASPRLDTHWLTLTLSAFIMGIAVAL
ncbi:hypothetical protein V8F20_004443 [Naviculisporaceae sp. PSN 640]